MMVTQTDIEEYWNRQPCNIGHSLSTVGTKEYFEEVTDKRFRVEPHILDFAKFYLWRGKRVLEIGCGIGTDAEQFARHGADYTGIDISDQSLHLCRERFKLFGLNGNFELASFSDQKLMNMLGKFDLVYSFGVLHHFPGIKDNIKIISKSLAPGGEFRFMVYAKNSWKYAMIQKGLDQFEAQADCPYAQAFTKDDIFDMLKDTGLRVERIRQDHCFMYSVPEYKRGGYVLEPWFAAMPDIMRDAVRENLGWHLLVKAKLVDNA